MTTFMVTTIDRRAIGCMSLAELREAIGGIPAAQPCTVWRLPDADVGAAARIFDGPAIDAASFADRFRRSALVVLPSGTPHVFAPRFQPGVVQSFAFGEHMRTSAGQH